MSRIHPECPDSTDVLLRQKPAAEEDDEEDEGEGKELDEDDEKDEGYSE